MTILCEGIFIILLLLLLMLACAMLGVVLTDIFPELIKAFGKKAAKIKKKYHDKQTVKDDGRL